MEVGGNFNLTQTQLDLLPSACDLSGMFRYWKHVSFTSSAREALALLLNNWTPKNKTGFLPEYLCHTEIEPFVRRGYSVLYYPINIDLTPDAKALDALVRDNPYSCLYVQSYFGKDTLEQVRTKFLDYRSKEGVSIIEDQTQIWLGEVPREGADFYIISLRKWLEIPDGGVLASVDYEVERFTKEKQVGELSELFVKASLLKENYYKTGDELLKQEFRPLYYQMNDVFSSTTSPHEMGDLSKRVLLCADMDLIRRKRCENYAALQIGLRGIRGISIPFENDENRGVPLYFPVYVDDRTKFQQYLIDNKVYCPILWPCPINEENCSATARYIYNHILCIPCDQRYAIEDMKTITTLIKQYGI